MAVDGIRRLAVVALCAALLTGCASARAQPPKVPILVYHRLGDPPHGERNPSLYVTPPRFRAQVRALARAGFDAVTLGRVWSAWHGGATLPPRPVVITFDDGYAEQDAIARPALRALRWPGVLNLQLDHLDARGGLSRTAVARMTRDGWEIGDHTLTHPDLTKVGATRLRAEVAGSRAALRRALGVDARFFCYPYGRQNAAVRRAVKAAGFLAATTIEPGLAAAGQDRLALPRIVVRRTTQPAELVHVATG